MSFVKPIHLILLLLQFTNRVAQDSTHLDFKESIDITNIFVKKNIAALKD